MNNYDKIDLPLGKSASLVVFLGNAAAVYYGSGSCSIACKVLHEWVAFCQVNNRTNNRKQRLLPVVPVGLLAYMRCITTVNF